MPLLSALDRDPPRPRKEVGDGVVVLLAGLAGCGCELTTTCVGEGLIRATGELAKVGTGVGTGDLRGCWCVGTAVGGPGDFRPVGGRGEARDAGVRRAVAGERLAALSCSETAGPGGMGLAVAAVRWYIWGCCCCCSCCSCCCCCCN